MSGYNYVVYKHTNITNGKSYIGVTNNPKVRWAGSGHNYQCYNSLFGRAIQKYGWDGFTHDILESCLSKEEAAMREKYYIALYKTNAARYSDARGYNLTDGGDGMCGVQHSADTRERISLALTNPRPETRKKMSNASIGRCVFAGRSLSDEHKRKLAAGRDRANAERGRPVYCINNATVYKSAAEAGRQLSISPSTISGVCRGRYHHSGGYKFRYASMQEVQDAGLSVPKRVVCIETGESFNSLLDAAKHICAPVSYISRCCDNSNSSTRGFRWRYE